MDGRSYLIGREYNTFYRNFGNGLCEDVLQSLWECAKCFVSALEPMDKDYKKQIGDLRLYGVVRGGARGASTIGFFLEIRMHDTDWRSNVED